jgi:hypothetical protein
MVQLPPFFVCDNEVLLAYVYARAGGIKTYSIGNRQYPVECRFYFSKLALFLY